MFLVFILNESVTASASKDFSSRLYVFLIQQTQLNKNNKASLKPPENTCPKTSTKLPGCHSDEFHKGFENGFHFILAFLS